MSHSLASSTRTIKTHHLDKSNKIQHASIVINQEDKKSGHFSLSSGDNNNTNSDGKDLHYSRYYKCSIIIISFLSTVASGGLGNSW